MRKSATLFVVLGLVAGLTACSAPEEAAAPGKEPTANSSECLAASGTGSEAVSLDGEFGTTPTVEFAFPMEVTETERTVIEEGDGDVVASGDAISTGFAMYNGTTGEEISNSIAEGQAAELVVSADQILPGLVSTFQCSTVGSRVVAVIPPSEMWGEQGYADLGVGGTDSVVMVADIVSIVPPLEPAEWSENVPEVELGDKPVVTLPEGDAPAELQLAVLKEGDGDVVEATDPVTIDYQGTSWETREVFDESYGKEPITLPANQFVKGFTAALVGQKVGSTLLVTIPAEHAYGDDPEAHQLGGQSLAFLIEIKAIG
ncbi:MAG: FKBP-type peptidyl-prolyl cis-trans isomerase [Homoserinimonas sp.]